MVQYEIPYIRTYTLFLADCELEIMTTPFALASTNYDMRKICDRHCDRPFITVSGHVTSLSCHVNKHPPFCF